MARNEEQARKAVSKSLFSNFLTEGLEGIRRGRHNVNCIVIPKFQLHHIALL